MNGEIKPNFGGEDNNGDYMVQEPDIEKKGSMKKSESGKGAAICRICLSDENTPDNQMISPCKCDGTMKFIHIECLRGWLNSKRTYKENEAVKTYCWKILECELCKIRFPDRINLENGAYIELISYDIPDKDFLVLESVTQ
eukprot:CAMPEP_0170551042 /NCGR_PEP_ID=MMETSP0211-20121228/9051_1 /TAXON_ID=311385 /ORGANISM="Pseudokeronopsis sp., Strain OXSARD2" /LENGTH=140 /DNA_ID=CAMNT_0010857941 /DNA_START=746 /DNA_END=1168 /DNA_ORIENTATION=-